MIDRVSIESALYSRQQVSRLTGIDDSTLNYWMREGVLQAAEGGTGKGQHRRFPYHQINLALLLDQLRGFGVSLPAIQRLADRFHSAIAHYERTGITRENYDPLSSIVSLRRDVEKHGFVSQSVEEDKLEKYVELFPWLADRMIWRTHKHLAFKFEASFEESVDIYRHAYLAYGRTPEPTERYTDEIVDLAKNLDLAAYSAAYPYWTAITNIEEYTVNDLEDSYYTPLIVYRNSEGEWEITQGDPSSSMRSYVGVYLERLIYEAWSKL